MQKVSNARANTLYLAKQDVSPQLLKRSFQTTSCSLLLAFALGNGCTVLFVLEALVLMKEVVVEGLAEDAVDLLCQLNLCGLELAQVLSHHGVFEVGVHHGLEDVHVFGVELAHAFVQKTTDFRVANFFFFDHFLDVVFAVCEV
jgi:hypothetical protein